MLVLNRTPEQLLITRREAGRFEFEDTKSVVENGQVAFRLTIETNDNSRAHLYFFSQLGVTEFLKTN